MTGQAGRCDGAGGHVWWGRRAGVMRQHAGVMRQAGRCDGAAGQMFWGSRQV